MYAIYLFNYLLVFTDPAALGMEIGVICCILFEGKQQQERRVDLSAVTTRTAILTNNENFMHLHNGFLFASGTYISYNLYIIISEH